MNNRAPLFLAVVVVLALIAIFLNFDLLRPGYRYPAEVLRLLTWQGERPHRSLALREGLDLQGGLQVLLQGENPAPGDMERAADTIKNRVDALGVTEPFVQTQGADKIVVELPGVQDPDLAVRTIGQTAMLEFVYSGSDHPATDTEVRTSWAVSKTLFSDLGASQQVPHPAQLPITPGPREAMPTTAVTSTTAAPITATRATAALTGTVTATAATTVTAPATTTVAATTTVTATAVTTTTAASDTTAAGGATDAGSASSAEVTVYPTVLTGDYLQSASIGLDPVTSEIVVNFQLNNEGGQLMQAFTREHLSSDARNEVMPIVLDGKIISSPRVNGIISTQGMITGRFSQNEAKALAAQLNSGALPVQLTVVGQKGIGPTLGRESLDAALRGGLIGVLAVMLFMLLYYRLPGILADLALLLYALFSLSLFRLLPVTLTLAGIAGFILSVGMAVDANILIFERMKEEVRAGRRLSAAIDFGFQRAWPSIRESNVSTLITCAILFWFGSQFGASIVKGFAVTLSLGVLTSMFTAILVTRNFLWLANRLLRLDERRTPILEDRRLRYVFGF